MQGYTNAAPMSASDTIRAAVPTSPAAGIRLLARLGFAAIGVVYGLMGLLALLAAIGPRGGHVSKSGAVRHLRDLPGGQILLILIAVGLLGYVIWRFTQALADTEERGTDAKGIAMRVGYAGSGLFYVGLALLAGRLAWSGHAEDNGDQAQGLTAKVLAWPAGDWLIMLVGAVTIGVGGYQMYRAYKGRPNAEVNARQLSATQARLVRRAGQVGLTARGLVLAIIGYFFVRAGWQSRAQPVGSTDEAFDFLATFGPWALGVVAAGLLLYGLYSLVRAKYPLLKGL